MCVFIVMIWSRLLHLDWSHSQTWRKRQTYRESLNLELSGGHTWSCLPGEEWTCFMCKKKGANRYLVTTKVVWTENARAPWSVLLPLSRAHSEVYFQGLSLRGALANGIGVEVLYTSPALKILLRVILHSLLFCSHLKAICWRQW